MNDLTPASILAAAKATAPAKPHPRNYVEAIRVLMTDKLMTGKEVAVWFAQHGLHFSASGIHSALTEADSQRIAAQATAAKQPQKP